MTTLSDRLANALVALEDAASCYDGAKATDLRTAARSYARVADEVDGYVDPDAVTKGRAQAISDYEILRTRTDADIAALQDEVRRLDDARSSLHARAEAAERDLAVAKTEAWRNDRRADEHMADLAAIASHLKCGHVLPAVKAAIDALRNKAETAECRVSELEAEVNSRANEGHELFKQRNAAQDRVAELTKPGSATDDVFPVIWRRAIGVPSDAGHFGPRDIKAAREIYSLGLAHGRAEQAARVAELEDDRESMSRSHRVDTADSVRVAVSEWKERARNVDERHASASVAWRERDAQWQTATGAAGPAGVRRLTVDDVRSAYLAVPWTATDDFGAEVPVVAEPFFRALTAPGPVVLPGATPSTRPAVEAFDLPAINWTERKARYRTDTDGFHAECWWQDEQVGDGAAWTATLVGKADTLDDARATVERAHRLLTGTTCRETDRLRDAVVEAALTWWREDREASAWGYLNGPLRALSANLVAQAPAQVAQPAPVEPPSPTCGEFAPKSGYPDMCRNCHEPKWRHPAPVEPAKGERFVKVAREDIAGRPANMREDESSAHFAASFYNGSPHEFHDDTDVPGYAAWPWAVVDTAPPVATPAPSDVERLAAAIRSAKFPTLPTDAIGSTYLAEAILRHLAGPLPGVDRAEELIAAYVDAFAETSGTICDRWSDVDQKRKDHAIATMRRALLAVGAQEPARVTAPIIDEIVNAADEWAGDSDPDTSVYSRETTRLLRSVRVLRARRIGRTVAP